MADPQSLPTTYGYDVLNRLTSLAFNGQNPGFGFGYDGLSRRTSLTRPNGINTTYAYNPGSMLTSILHKLGTTTLDGATYVVDNTGNRTSRTDKRTNTTLTYTYDALYELQLAKQGTTTKESYTYDAVGNRLSSLGVSPYLYNSSNELTSLPNVGYTYDNNGNTKTKTDGSGITTYNWDYENRLTSVVLPGSGGTVTFKYDPFGRRVQKSGPSGSMNYLYDGDNLLEEVEQSGTVLARYTQGLNIDEPLTQLRSGTTSYYETDGLGSVTSLTNASGTIANTYTYDTFGNLSASTGAVVNPLRYTAREFDGETGQYFYRARYYEASVGRFASEDLARDHQNWYVYTGNRPTVFSDPSGLHSVFYDGDTIRVFDDSGALLLRCRATTGRPGTGPADQNRPWDGPLPRGTYWLDPSEFSGGGFVAWRRNLLGDWGNYRVPLHPFPGTNSYGREDFFLHGGKKPGSAGCLDVGPCDTAVYVLLRGHDGPVRVDVRYTNFVPF